MDEKRKDGEVLELTDDEIGELVLEEQLASGAYDEGFPHPTFFIDDGYSGVDFSNRPGFQKMLSEVEAGNVATIITKDLSRLGRNSAMTGLYINYTFPQNAVRYIAINHHFDTINMNSTDSDIAGIKN